MSNNQNEYKGSSFWQLILVIPGTILAFTLIIALIAKVFGVKADSDIAEPAAAVAKVEENIKPVATVDVASVSAGPKAEKSGEEVYKSVCMMCHDAGLMAAPKFGDKAQWAPRIAQGYDTLVTHAIQGIRSMPAKGGNPSLTDGEVASAVAHMANAGGANFKAPAAMSAEPAAETSTAKSAAAPTASAPALVTDLVEAAEAAAPKPADTKVAGKSGEEVYKSVCMMCHAAGLMAAPKFGDKAQWEPRIAQGYDTLVMHAVKGIRMMPAKGGNASLSDDEVAGAVKYMANAAGAKF